MKICIISDLHIPYDPNAIENEVFDFALEDAKSCHADAIAFTGDVTADGHPDSLARLHEKLAGCDVPVVLVPGNSDYRTPETREMVAALEKNPLTKLGDTKIIALFDGRATVCDEVYELLESADEKTIVFGHHPLWELKGEHAQKMQQWRQSHPNATCFFGHKHIFKKFDDYTYQLTPADPDKAIGEMPAIFYFDTETGDLEKHYFDCPMPSDFAEYLGLSCRCIEPDLNYATARKLKHIELRAPVIYEPADKLLPILEKWREDGGVTLSLHAPHTLNDDGEFCEEDWRRFAAAAKTLGADRITLHTPELSTADATDERLTSIAQKLVDFLSELEDSLILGIENMHMTKGETIASHRFGYAIDECVRYTDIMRSLCTKNINMHFDVGHARNNRPISERYTIPVWYSQIGRRINGYHIHQVATVNGKTANHQPIDSWYGRTISYAALFAAWSRGTIAKAPVFLEIRPPEGYKATFELLDQTAKAAVEELYDHEKAKSVAAQILKRHKAAFEELAK